MTNLEKYNNAFIETFEISEDKLKGLKYQDITAWDSVGHMNLIAAIEDAFDIMMDTDDIIDFSSFKKGIEILKKYDVIIEDKLNSNQYDENNMSDKDAPYYDESNNTSYYLQAIMKMLPKLNYKEQLIVLEKLAGMVQLSTEYELKPKKKTSFYEELEKLNNKYHLRSDGKGWTRDELYER